MARVTLRLSTWSGSKRNFWQTSCSGYLGLPDVERFKRIKNSVTSARALVLVILFFSTWGGQNAINDSVTSCHFCPVFVFPLLCVARLGACLSGSVVAVCHKLVAAVSHITSVFLAVSQLSVTSPVSGRAGCGGRTSLKIQHPKTCRVGKTAHA